MIIEKGSNFIKLLFALLISYIGMTVIATSLLFLVYLIPSESLQENKESSIQYLSQYIVDGDIRPALFFPGTKISPLIDTWMVEISSDLNHESYVDQVLLSYYESSEDVLGICYARYWHGYQILLRPLLLFADYIPIAVLSEIVSLFLIICLSKLLWKRNKKYMLAFVAAILTMLPFTTAWSITNTMCFDIFLLISIILVQKFDYFIINYYLIYVLFFISGMLTGFFDLLTFPLMTFAIPLIILLMLDERDNNAFLVVKNQIGLGIIWSVGYTGFWVMKWVLASVFTSKNIIADAINSVSIRTSQSSTGGVDVSLVNTFIRNFGYFLSNPMTILIIVTIIIIMIMMIKNKSIPDVNSCIPYVTIFLLPFIWYCLTVNHSCIHARFTYKEITIAVFAITAFIARNTTKRSKKSDPTWNGGIII